MGEIVTARGSTEVIPDLRLSEILAALSHALDLTEGQPPGHCIRSCLVAVHIGREMGLPDANVWELYYAVLLKDLGCSSNAARLCELYLADDIWLKGDFKHVGDGLPQVLGFILSHTGLKAGMAERFRAILNILRNGGDLVREVIETRCQRGGDIAERLRFPGAVSDAIRSLDEHWDGRGKPNGLSGPAVPLYSRIALLAQVVDVFHTAGGPEAALREARARSGTWFDPHAVACLEAVAARGDLWPALACPDIDRAIYDLEPASRSVPVTEDYLDDIAASFALVVDSKSPYTAGHSDRVALYADMVAEELGFDGPRRRWLKRAALLHDIGKLGVSNSILDKPAKLDDSEWVDMRRHA